jgi:hypothetical protein
MSSKRKEDTVVENMPSVMKEIPFAGNHPIPGMQAQHERPLAAGYGGTDALASPGNPDSPDTFQRLLQKSLRGHNQDGVHAVSPGDDHPMENGGIMTGAGMRTGTDVEAQTPAGEEIVPESDHSPSEPGIHGTERRKISKTRYHESAENPLTFPGNIAPVNEYRNLSPEGAVGNHWRLNSHKDPGGEMMVVAAEDAENVESSSAGHVAENMIHSRETRRRASMRTEDQVLFSRKHVGGNKAISATGVRAGGSDATGNMGVTGDIESPGNPSDSIRAIHAVETPLENVNKSAVAGASLLMLSKNTGERIRQTLTGERALHPLTALGAAPIEAGPDAEEMMLFRGGRRGTSVKTAEPIRAGQRHDDGRKALVETENGDGGNGNTEAPGSFGDSLRIVHSGESRQVDGGNSGAFSVAPLPFKTSTGERIHQPMAVGKLSHLAGTFTAVAADATTPLPASDIGEGIFSAGRQNVLLAQVIETAQPLMQHGGGRVVISLNPPSLGALDIDVRVKRDSVELFVVANNRDVQQTLCSHIEQLRKALVDQGLNMDRFQVVVGDRSDGQHGRDPRQEGMSGWQGESKGDRGYHSETDGGNASEEMGWAVRSDTYPSVGGINVFI